MCAGEIIRAVRNNHPSGKRPIHTAGYEDIPGSFWKRGLYDILEDIERKVNKASRELVAHTGASLGFFGELDMTRLGRNPIGNELPLNKILRTDGDYTRGGHSALRLHSIDSKIGDALRLIQEYEREAEDATGIRKFMTGATDLGVAGRTNGVVNALQTNSSKLIVMTQGNVNVNVIAEVVRYFYELELYYGKDKSIRGDLQVVVHGSDGLAAKEVFEAKFEKIMQYGSKIYTMQGPDGLPMIDPRDIQMMHNRYFEMNGVDLRYTNRPDQKINFAPSTEMGTGEMPQIDGRSNPVNVSGGAGPISPI
jgi:ribosomal silencing factor RsfS